MPEEPSSDSSLFAQLLKRYVEEPLRTPEAQAYAEAGTVEHLCYQAGQHIAAHAFQMTNRLGLRWPGTIPLAVFRFVARARFRQFVVVRLRAFAACCVADLGALRELLTSGGRAPPNLPRHLQRLFAMACVHAGSALMLDQEEKKILLDVAAPHISQFLDHPDWARERFVARVLDLPEIRARRLGQRRTAEFVGKAMLEGTTVNVIAFRRDLERLAG